MSFIKVKANNDPDTDLYLNTENIVRAEYGDQVIQVYYSTGTIYTLNGITQQEFEEMIGITTPPQP